MKKEEFDKKLKWTKIFCIIIGTLFVVVLVMGITQQQYISTILSLGFIILLFLFYSLTKKEKIAGPIIGIGLGILYILELNILTIIIGIFIIIDSISMLRYIKQNNENIDNEDVELDSNNEKYGTKINLIGLILIIIIMASLVGLEIFLLIGNNKNKVENENVKIENQNTKLTEFNVSEDVSIYCDQNWKQTEYEDDEGKFELLDYKNAEMSLSFVSEENLGDEYSLSDESGRELLYNNFFIGFDEIDEPKDRSERFQLLNNNLYYIYFGTYNNLFDVYQRFYVVINSNTEQGYIFEISAKNQFTKEQEKSILKVLSTVKSK